MNHYYDGPRTLAGFKIPVAWKPKAPPPSQAQNTAAALTASDTAQRDALLGNVQSTLGAARPTLSRITDINPATGTTALRQALTTSLTGSTNQAYNNAEVANRARAASMGLANQPLTAGNDAALENQRASALGQIPSEVEKQATPEELQASNLLNQQANTQLGAMGQYNPNAPLSTEAGLQKSLYDLQAQQQSALGGLFGGLAKAGLGLINPIKIGR